jgi:hypothetical protein
MISGYAILVRQAFASPNRKQMLKGIFWSLDDGGFALNPRGKKLIYTGAALGLAAFLCLILTIVIALTMSWRSSVVA